MTNKDLKLLEKARSYTTCDDYLPLIRQADTQECVGRIKIIERQQRFKEEMQTGTL